jgi:hypothetical protein
MMKERRREKREENKKENKFEEGGEGRWTDRIRLSTIQHIIVPHSIVQHIIAQHSTALSLHHSIQHCITEEGKAQRSVSTLEVGTTASMRGWTACSPSGPVQREG